MLAGTEPERVLALADEILGGRAKVGKIPPYWDGHTAARIVEILEDSTNQLSAG